MSTHRHYGLPRKQQLMRPDQAHKQRMRSLWHALQVIAGLLLLLAVYGWAGARDAQAEVEDEKFHTEVLLTSYMNHGAVQDEETIFTCAHKTYELPKGETK